MTLTPDQEDTKRRVVAEIRKLTEAATAIMFETDDPEQRADRVGITVALLAAMVGQLLHVACPDEATRQAGVATATHVLNRNARAGR